MDSDGSLLAVVLDASLEAWALPTAAAAAPAPQQQQPTGIPGGTGVAVAHWMAQLAAFLNSFLLLHSRNRLVVIATGSHTSSFVYPIPAPTKASKGSAVESQAVEGIIQRLTEFMEREASSAESLLMDEDRAKREAAGAEPMEEDTDNRNTEGVSNGQGGLGRSSGGAHLHPSGNTSSGNSSRPKSALLSAALSLSLTYLVKALKQEASSPQQLHPRILCIHGSTDGPQQYVAVMNAIFSAQKHKIPINSLIFGATDSAFLQQAAFLTDGSYWRLRQNQSLLQCLLLVFGPDHFSRSFLHLPKPSGVDFRAACFCHKKTVDLGYVCSVCLSIFCTRTKACSTCGATFSSQSGAAPTRAPVLPSGSASQGTNIRKQ